VNRMVKEESLSSREFMHRDPGSEDAPTIASPIATGVIE
jgi:hypothetical protein